jgi:hypothetical protein
MSTTLQKKNFSTDRTSALADKNGDHHRAIFLSLFGNKTG